MVTYNEALLSMLASEAVNPYIQGATVDEVDQPVRSKFSNAAGNFRDESKSWKKRAEMSAWKADHRTEKDSGIRLRDSVDGGCPGTPVAQTRPKMTASFDQYLRSSRSYYASTDDLGLDSSPGSPFQIPGQGRIIAAAQVYAASKDDGQNHTPSYSHHMYLGASGARAAVASQEPIPAQLHAQAHIENHQNQTSNSYGYIYNSSLVQPDAHTVMAPHDHTTSRTYVSPYGQSRMKDQASHDEEHQKVEKVFYRSGIRLDPETISAAKPRTPLPNAQPHRSWRPAPKNTTKCDVCNSRAMGKTVHQRCQKCSVVICRNCVEEGMITRFGNHAQMDVSQFNWGKMPLLSRARINKSNAKAAAHTGPAVPTEYTEQPAVRAPVLSRPQGRTKSPKNTPEANRRQSKQQYRHLLSKATLTNNTTNHILRSTPHKSLYTHTHTIFGSDNDKWETGKISSASDSNREDGDYKPPGQITRSRKHSAQMASSSASDDKVSIPLVGLANSRPVRAAAIDTYEKMCKQSGERQGRHRQLDAVNEGDGNMELDHQVDDNAQMGRVYHHGVQYLPGDNFVEQYEDGHSPSQTAQHQHGLTTPDSSDISSPPLIHFANSNTRASRPFSFSAALALDALLDDAMSRSIPAENGSGKAYEMAMLKFQKAVSELTAQVTNHINDNGKRADSKELTLINVVHNFWFTNSEARSFRRIDEVDAIHFLRCHVDVATRKLGIEGDPAMKQWLDATEREIQEKSDTFVPRVMQVQEGTSAVAYGNLSYLVTEPDVQAANSLLAIRVSDE